MSYDLMNKSSRSRSRSKSRKSPKSISIINDKSDNYYTFDEEEKIDAIMNTRKIKLSSKKIQTEAQSMAIKSIVQIEKKNDPIIEVFGQKYPNKTIKPLQYEIIKSLSEGVDTIGILPTGYGKSLCYQLPYFLNPDKVVIVVSPLISLMEDQKAKLEKLEIPVACFHSNVGRKKKQEIKEELLENLVSTKDETDIFIDDDTNKKKKSPKKEKQIESEKKLSGMVIFLTPEYLIGCENWIKRLAGQNKLSLVAMDEAHCISTWGHDFRPDYQGLYRVKDWIEEFKVPILALTATATAQVENDIKTFLQLSDPKVFKTSFDRPNLIISVKPKPKQFNPLFEIINKYNNDFAIIYCKTRDKAEELSEFLKENLYNVDVYHAGLSANSRQEIQEKFAKKELNIIVATIAFGMGIDQDVHLVVHWGCPSDMESYYQEIGRAGRDGVESECIMFYDKEDFRVSRYFLRSLTDVNYKRFKDEQISKMERYCLLNQCRRKIILTHFGENLPQNYNCAKCDNCNTQNKVNTVAIDNLCYPIFIIAKTVFLGKCKMGANKISLVLRGSKSKNISYLNNLVTYGLLKELSEEQIKNLINIMTINGYLKDKTITGGFGTVLETTSKLITWYNKICNEANCRDSPRQTKNQLSYDSLYKILEKSIYKLELNIPTEFNHITKIRFKTTVDNMLDEFSNEIIDIDI